MRLRISPHGRPAFQICGVFGFCLATAVAAILTARLGLSFSVLAAMLVSAALVFFAQAMAVKVITGKERLVYYYHEIAVLAAVALLLHVSKHPLLPYLDVTALSLGLFLACGRIGCLLAGCCHGRPHPWGVRHDGALLFPVQALESACVLVIVAVGIALILVGPSGAALTWYLVAYGVVRFAMEFLRGDATRPYWLGLSEAQWISLASIGLVAHAWQRAPDIIVPVLALAIVTLQYLRASFTWRLCRPAHIRELAHAAEHLSEAGSSSIRVAETSLGIRISGGPLQCDAGPLHHFALSRASGRLGERKARSLAEALVRARQLALVAFIHRPGRVFHVLARASAPPGQARSTARVVG